MDRERIFEQATCLTFALVPLGSGTYKPVMSRKGKLHHYTPQPDMLKTKRPFSRLLAFLSLLLRLRNLLGGIDGAHRPMLSNVEPSPPTDAESRRRALPGLLLRLQKSLPVDCKQLDRGTIEVVGPFPAAAGGIANVWEGRIGERKVAIKSYRCYLSSDRLPTDVVSNLHLLYMLFIEDTPTEVLQRSVYGEPPQTPKHSFVHWMVFDAKSPTGSRF